jgi:hypothetical protein
VTGGNAKATVNANGGYTLTPVGPGPITVTVTYTPPRGQPVSKSATVTVPAGGRVQLNFTLP